MNSPGGSLEKSDIEHEGERERDERSAEHRLPAPDGGDARRGEVVDDDADVARSGKTEDHALHVRRIPAARLGQRDGEAGAREPSATPSHSAWMSVAMPNFQATARLAITTSWAMMPVRLGADAVHQQAERDAQETRRRGSASRPSGISGRRIEPERPARSRPRAPRGASRP